MSTADQCVEKLMKLEGAIAAMLVDADSGMLLASKSNGFDTDAAAAGNTRVVQAKRDTMELLGLNDRIEDILISLEKQYHLIRPMTDNSAVFGYLVVSHDGINLAMARATLKKEIAVLEL